MSTAKEPEVKETELPVVKGEIMGNALICHTDDCTDIVPFNQITDHYKIKHGITNPQLSTGKGKVEEPSVKKVEESAKKAKEAPVEKPKMVQDPKTGRIIRGVAQETNKNGTAGHPCHYCKDKERIQSLTDKYYEECKKDKGKVPYQEELELMYLNITEELLDTWKNKKKVGGQLEHPEFHETIKNLKRLQRLRLQERTLKARTNPTGAIFQLKVNHGFIETEKKVIAGDKDEPLEFVIVEDKGNNKED